MTPAALPPNPLPAPAWLLPLALGAVLVLAFAVRALARSRLTPEERGYRVLARRCGLRPREREMLRALAAGQCVESPVGLLFNAGLLAGVVGSMGEGASGRERRSLARLRELAPLRSV